MQGALEDDDADPDFRLLALLNDTSEEQERAKPRGTLSLFAEWPQPTSDSDLPQPSSLVDITPSLPLFDTVGTIRWTNGHDELHDIEIWKSKATADEISWHRFSASLETADTLCDAVETFVRCLDCSYIGLTSDPMLRMFGRYGHGSYWKTMTLIGYGPSHRLREVEKLAIKRCRDKGLNIANKGPGGEKVGSFYPVFLYVVHGRTLDDY